MLHELRLGELANLNLIPHTPYYGTVDATPLFLILLTEYVNWTGDIELVKQLEGNVDRALKWIDVYANMEGNGFAYYAVKSPLGIYNQGWKDSFDSISHSDGTLAKQADRCWPKYRATCTWQKDALRRCSGSWVGKATRPGLKRRLGN